MDTKGQKKIGGRVATSASLRSQACAPWVTLLPDAADGLLTEMEQRLFDQHVAGCAGCAEELASAQVGLAWLTVLKDQTPEPPSTMLAKILAQTTGLEEAGVYLPSLPAATVWVEPQTVGAGAGAHEALTGWRSWFGLGEDGWSGLAQPRLAMTAAMAFFSICLTLNLVGVPVSQLNARTLRTGSLPRTVENTGISLMQSLQGLRVVYKVESRVNEMRAEMSDPDSETPNR